MSSKVVTGKVRGSYVNVFNPRFNDLNGQEEYSMSILIPKSDKETIDKIKKVMNDLVHAKWNGKPPLNLRNPLRDGDEEKPTDPNYQDHYFMNVKSKDAPGIIDRDMNKVIDAGEFISGDYCRVSLNGFAYDMKGNRGVSFGLNNIQILERGEPLTSRARAEDDFGAWSDGDGDGPDWF